MPSMNGFEAHIFKYGLGDKTPNKKQLIPEESVCIQDNGIDISSVIRVNTGDFFGAWWWPKCPRQKESHLGFFERDGATGSHIFYTANDSKHCKGVTSCCWPDNDDKEWHFQFGEFKCTGMYPE